LIEKRKMQRFAVAIRSTVWPQNIGKAGAPLSLVSRDVSAAGAFFLTSTPLDVGTPVRVVMLLALGEGDQQAAANAQVTISGTIVRVEEKGMAVRFAKRYKMSAAPPRETVKDLCTEVVH
jgi:hypothetical protein